MAAQTVQLGLYLVFLVIIFPFALFNLILTKTAIIPGIKPFVIVSQSMRPKIGIGSIIYALKEKNYNTGDVITFNVNNNVISHRIIGIKKVAGTLYFVTQGDANLISDVDLVLPQEIVGKVSFVIPMVGDIILFLKTPLGLIIGGVLPISLALRKKFLDN